MSTDALVDLLRSRIAEARRRTEMSTLAQGAVAAAIPVLLALFAAVAAEAVLDLPPGPRTVLFWLTLGAVALIPAAFLGGPLLRLFNVLPGAGEEAVARAMGVRLPGVGDRLQNLLSLDRERHSSPPVYSLELIDAAFSDLEDTVNSLDPGMLVDPGPLRRRARMLAAAAGAIGLCTILLPGPLSASLDRLIHHSMAYDHPAPFVLEVDPGDAEVVKGSNVTVRVRIVGQQVEEVFLGSRPDGQTSFDETRLTSSSPGGYRHEFRTLRSSTEYYARSGIVESRRYRLTVRDRPVLTRLRLTLQYPAYSGLGTHALDDNVGDVTALNGTTVRLLVEASKELGAAEMVFADSTIKPLGVRGRTADGIHHLRHDTAYLIRIRDTEGTAGMDPITYSMKVVPDAFPTASIPVPGANLDVADNTRLGLLFRIADDYGFSRLRLAYRLVHSRYEQPQADTTFIEIPMPAMVATEALVPFTWDLTALSLVPEDMLQYQVQVFDNDRVSGPKAAFSESFTLRLPSLEEVFADVERDHAQGRQSLEKALEKAVEARKELEQLRRDLRSDPKKLEWQEQQRAQEISRRYAEITGDLDQTRQLLEQLADQMKQSRVLSEETLAKYQELQRVMEQIQSPEFAEAMKRLQQSLQQMNPEALRQALAQMQFSEDQFRRSIERTLQLLKRIQIEQKVDEAIRRAEELARRQEDLRERTARTDPSDRAENADLSREQKDLRESLDGLKTSMDELQNRMQDFPREMPVAEMDTALEALDREQPGDRMDDAARSLQAGKNTEAMTHQQAAQKGLRRFAESMQQVGQALRRNQRQQIVNELRRAGTDLVELSRRQESLRNAARELEQNSPRTREEAQRQMDMLRDLSGVAERLGGLSRKTFSVTPEMGKSLGDAVRSMQQAVQALDERNAGGAAENQTSSMASLNEAAAQVQSALESMMQGGGQGIGMAGFLQRLQQLSGMQQGINESTRNMQGMSQEQAAAMARLAGEQGMVRKSLEELAKEASRSGELSKLLGDLNRIAQEMREVQTDIAQHDVSEKTLRTQDRILSRLLDSQRSMRERDYERRRRAETGSPTAGTPPGPIDLSTAEGRSRLRQDLLRALDQGYARDYQELIRRYFEALEQ